MFFLYIARRFTIYMIKKKATEVKKENTKTAPKKPVLTNTKQKTAVAAPNNAPAKPSRPDPKHKLILEYIIYASPKLLFEFITSPSGLSEWFADDVTIIGKVYTFIWEGSKQMADVLNMVEGKSIRFHWTDRASDYYFEFRIEKNELTHELSLVITDFAETEDEKNSLEVLWQGQVQRLMKVIGSKA